MGCTALWLSNSAPTKSKYPLGPIGLLAYPLAQAYSGFREVFSDQPNFSFPRTVTSAGFRDTRLYPGMTLAVFEEAYQVGH